MGAGVIACADTATDKAKPAITINLIILYLLKPFDNLDFSQQGSPAIVFKQHKLPAVVAPKVDIDQGLWTVGPDRHRSQGN